MINVLSLFDGMSCGQIALNKLGIKYDKYFASEIDKNAIEVTQDNYPNTIQLGSVTDVKAEDLPKIDLLIGGSPCQSFSLAGKKEGMSTTENIEVTSLEKYLEYKESGYEFKGQSYLFWEYVRLLKELKPKYFLLENVMMKPMWKDVISETLDVDPILIDSKHFSIQSRKRLYWTNISVSEITSDENDFKFSDMYCKEYAESLVLKGIGLNKLNRPRCRVYDINDSKLPTLLKAQEVKPTDSIVIKHDDIYRYPSRREGELMQTVPIGYTKKATYNKAMGMLGNGWTVDVIVHILKNMKF